MPGTCGLRPCARTHHKKGLVPHLPFGWGGQQIPQITLGLNLSSCRAALRPAVLSAARIWPSVSRYLEISFGLRGPLPRLLPRRHFWKCQARVGYGPALGPTIKSPSATHVHWVGWSSNTADHYRCYTNSRSLLTFSM